VFDNTFLLLQAFKFFPKDRKMALVQLGSAEEAVAALVKLHNYQLSETSHLRYPVFMLRLENRTFEQLSR
jgi:polypyrimidine tract-binding protein 1